MLIHPIFVHFPIAFGFLELILVLFWAYKKDPRYQDFARFVNHAALIFVLAAIVTGILDAGGLGPAWRIMRVRRHLIPASAASLLFVFRFFFWKSSQKDNIKFHLMQLVLLNMLLAAAGFFGGELVYGE